MINEKVIDYIKTSLAQDRSKEEIYKELLGQGWGLDAIKENFKAVDLVGVKGDSQQKVVKIIVTAGVIFIGAGIFSFIAANWQEMGRFIKVALIVILLVASYASGWYLKEKRGFIRIGGALFLLGAIIYGAGIVLVAQMFNISTNWPDGFILWMIGSIAMAFAIDSFPIFYLAIPIGTIALFGYPILMFADFRGGGNPFLMTSTLLLLTATIITFLTGWAMRKRMSPELKDIY